MNQYIFQRILRRVFWIPFVLAVIIGVALILELRFMMARAVSAKLSDQTISLSQLIYRNRVDQESDLRAYLLTGDKSFLDGFDEAKDQVQRMEPELLQLLSDNAEQSARHNEASRAFQAWSLWADQALAMPRTDADDVDFQLRGRQLMNTYRQIQSEFLNRERQLREAHRSHSQSVVQWINTSITILGVVLGLGVVLLGRKQLSGLSRSYADALKAAEDKQTELQKIIDATPFMLIRCNRDLRYLFVSHAYAAMLGLRPEEILGKQIPEMIGREGFETIRPHIERVLQGRREQYEDEIRYQTIGVRTIRAVYMPEHDEHENVTGWVASLLDITERRQAELQIRQQAALLDAAWDAIFVRDEQGTITFWNQGAEELYGWSREEALGKMSHELLRTQFPEPLPEVVARTRKEKRWQGELVHTCKNGERVTVLSRWAVLPTDEKGGLAPLIEINTDITRRKQLESALQSNEKLALAGQLSASIAHEIHNPLDVVGNVLFLLERQVGSQPDTRHLITTAQEQLRRVTDISRNMLNLYRESRVPVPVNISELLRGVIALIEETVAKRQRKIELVARFAGELEAFPAQLRQVFTNIIKNAVEATTKDGEIKIYTDRVEEEGQEGVLVRVIDNGTGIPEHMQSRLFTPFVTTKQQNGTGLGLWVSRSIVEKHGGRIRLENTGSEKDHRTVVSVFLPLETNSPRINSTERGAVA